MRIKNKILFFFTCLLCSNIAVAQTGEPEHGTIKVKKAIPGEVYIRASVKYDNYELPEKFRGMISSSQVFQPAPIVDGYAFPFNYTAFFTSEFKSKGINLKGKETDTVKISVKVLKNGKVYFKDLSSEMMIKGIPATPTKKGNEYELNALHFNCLGILKSIKKWYPGYVVLPKKDKFKNQTVIRPDKTDITVQGVITIVFSTTPFGEG